MSKLFLRAAVFFGVLVFSLMINSDVLALEGTPGGKIRAQVKQEIKQEIKDKFARISGATVDSVNTDSLVISKEGKTITVKISPTTKLRRKFWGTATVAEFSPADMVNVWGTWVDNTQTVVNATLVRNLSIQKRNGVFVGKVTAVSSTGWVMETFNRGPQTVTISNTTKLVDRTGKTMVQSSIVVGNLVRVRGMWDNKNNTITEVTTVKDYSLPVKVAEKTATPSATQ